MKASWLVYPAEPDDTDPAPDEFTAVGGAEDPLPAADRKAYEIFFEEHRPYILTYVQSKRATYADGGDAAVDIGDVVQETMIAAMVNWMKVRDITQPRKWLRRVADNKLIDQVRRSTKRKSFDMSSIDDLPIDNKVGPPGGLDMVLAQEALIEAFGLLSAPQREVLTKTMNGLSVTEIAQQTGLSTEAVYKHRNRARQVIRDLHKRRADAAESTSKPTPRNSAPILTLRTNRAMAATSVLTDQQLARQYPELARSLGVKHRAAKDRAHAVTLHEQLLANQERILGPDHLDTVAIRAGLARALREAGQHHRAVPVLERVLEDRERIQGPAHHDTATARAHLADTLQMIGQFHRAIEQYERVLADRVDPVGHNDSRTLTIQARLAAAYQAAGDLPRAITLFEHVLRVRARRFGRDRDATVAVRAKYAEALFAAEQYGRAIPILEDVLNTRTRKLSSHHPRTWDTLARLAAAYQAVGNLPRAIALFEEVLLERERGLGAHHADTMAVRAELAEALWATRQYEHAIPVLEAVLNDNERFHGPEHEQTRVTRAHLADSHEAIGQLDIALRFYKENLRLHEQAVGRDHFETIGCRRAVVRVLRTLGDLDNAIDVQKQVVADRERVYGKRSMLSCAARQELAAMLFLRNPDSGLQEPYFFPFTDIAAHEASAC